MHLTLYTFIYHILHVSNISYPPAVKDTNENWKYLNGTCVPVKIRSIWKLWTRRYGQIAQNRGPDSMGLVPGPTFPKSEIKIKNYPWQQVGVQYTKRAQKPGHLFIDQLGTRVPWQGRLHNTQQNEITENGFPRQGRLHSTQKTSIHIIFMYIYIHRPPLGGHQAARHMLLSVVSPVPVTVVSCLSSPCYNCTGYWLLVSFLVDGVTG